MVIDEVSLVDIPANQHSSVEIAKRAPEEAGMPEDLYDDGTVDVEEIGLDEAQPGDLIELEDGSVRELTAEDIEDLYAQVEEYAQSEPAEVGKAYGFGSIADEVRADIAKAFEYGDQDVAISKMADELIIARTQAQEATNIAKAMADRELEGKYVDVAKSWGIPGVDPAELGPVIKRVADFLHEDDQAVLAKALRSAGNTFRELGASGMSDMADPMAVVDSFVGGGYADFGKSLEGLSREQQVSKAFEMTPGAYDAYLAEYGS
jgi:hypothetical protein